MRYPPVQKPTTSRYWGSRDLNGFLDFVDLAADGVTAADEYRRVRVKDRTESPTLKLASLWQPLLRKGEDGILTIEGQQIPVANNNRNTELTPVVTDATGRVIQYPSSREAITDAEVDGLLYVVQIVNPKVINPVGPYYSSPRVSEVALWVVPDRATTLRMGGPVSFLPEYLLVVPFEIAVTPFMCNVMVAPRASDLILEVPYEAQGLDFSGSLRCIPADDPNPIVAIGTDVEKRVCLFRVPASERPRRFSIMPYTLTGFPYEDSKVELIVAEFAG